MPSKFMFLLLTFILIVTCCTFDSNEPAPFSKSGEHAHKVVHEPLMEKKQYIHKSIPGFFTEISFTEGAEALPDDARRKIKDLFEKTKRMGIIQTAKIISWGDGSLPDEKLVENRNDNLELFLEGLDFYLDVRKISMAERSKSYESLMARDDKLLKDKFKKFSSSSYSKSIVMLFLKKPLE
jgi:hypothetical protein